MAEALGLLDPLEQQLISQLKKKVKELKGVKREGEFLGLKLNQLVARMDDDLAKWKGDPGMATGRNNALRMRALVHDMEDCLDRFKYRIRQEKKAGLEGWIPLLMMAYSRIKLAKMMKKISEDLEKFNQSKGRQASSTLTEPASDGSEPLPSSKNIVGIAEARNKLLELVNTTGRDAERLRVIAIVGFGGSGKTTLAQEVYKGTQKEGDEVTPFGFPLRAWIDRAEYSNESGLLKRIIMKFWGLPDGEAIQAYSQRDLQDYIKTKLEGKRYLLVLDDIDNKDHWHAIRTTFDANAGTSSRIIVTTCFQSIANHCRDHGDSYVYQTRAIGDKASKQISRLVDDEYSEMLLKKCGGHPLALSCVANHLKSCDGRTPDKCKKLCDDLGEFLHNAEKDFRKDFERLRGVLMKKFFGLKNTHSGRCTVRSCLLYLGIFPIGRPIKRSKVTRRWVAEGYAEDDSSFDQFIERNIIQPIGVRNSSDWKVCQTLSILHEFVLHKSISENFIMAIDGQPHSTREMEKKKEKRKVRHIYVDASNIATSGSTDLSCVRSLTISKKAGLGGAFSKFSEYELLRVLDMEDCCDDVTENHIIDICKLWNLRYLSLGTNITNLQAGQSIAEKLEYLESLHLSKEVVSKLPVQVIRMPCLIHLIGKFRIVYKKEKEATALSGKSKLQTLAGVVADGGNQGSLLLVPFMKKLTKIKIWCLSNGDIKKLDTQLWQAIQMYTQRNMERSLSIDFKGLTQEDMDKLQNKQAGHGNKFFEKTLLVNTYLSSLKLHGISSEIPQFLRVLPDLTTLCLSLTTVIQQHLSSLSGIISLVHLKLIADHVAWNLVIKPGEFQRLESLCFEISGPSAAHLKIKVEHCSVPGSEETNFALPNVVSLQLLCKTPPQPSGIETIHLRKLQEIELHHEVKGEARIPWEEAAWDHPNRPNVLPLVSVDDPENPDDGTETEGSTPNRPNVSPPVSVNDPENPDGAREQSAENGAIFSRIARYVQKFTNRPRKWLGRFI